MEACENIGPGQRRRRIRIGATLVTLALVLAVVLVETQAARWLRLLVLLPLLPGSIGLLQVPAHTCVSLAARGLKDMDDGEKR